MSDPFSVAASAVSVVSLGIQVCQGLLSYYSDYKSYDDDIGSLCRKVEDLRSTLEICAEILQTPGLITSKASANVVKNMGACKDGLNSLQKTLGSCKNVPGTQGLKGNTYKYGQRILYPFKKSNVLQLQSTVSELQENFHTALLALQTEGLLDQKSILAVINANSIRSVKQGKHIHDGIERIERSVLGTYSALPDIWRQGEVSSSNLQALRDDVQSIHSDIGKYHASSMESFASLTTNLGRTSSTVESIILARLDDIARQNLDLRNSWDQFSELGHIRVATLERDVKSIQLGLLQKPSLFKSVYDQAKSLPRDSPAFALIGELFLHNMTFDDAKLVASQRVQRLRQMFQDGKASPYDVDIYGNILLHLATQYMTIYPTDRSMNKQDHLNLSMYLVGQIQLLGVPVNEANNSGDTILHLVIHLKGWDYDENIKQNLPLCVTGLMDLGAELPSIEYPSLRSTHLYLGHLMTKIIDMAEECNSISLAILRKSEDDLRRALTLSLSSINKVNNTGQSALHLAVEWPRGMELLLQAGANVDCKDCHNQSPLVYAIEMSLVEPMKLLARTDCSLLDTYSQVLLKRAIEIEDIAGLNRTQVTAAEMVVNLLVDMVVGRRQRLYDLATSALPVSDLDRLCRESYLPDESASQLYLALLRHGTAVPLALDPGKNRDTLFHQIRYSTRVAERLWKSGFRDINGRNSFGLTPLMHCGLHFPGIMKIWMEYAAWLVEKGADFYAKHDLTLYCEHKRIEYRSESQLVSATPLHFFAYCFGIISHVTARSRLRNWVEESHFESSKEMLQRVLMDNDSDACMCACSISGCTPFTVFTKSYKSVRYMEVSLVDLWPIAKNVCGPSKISNFLRMMTFKKLGMTHTCCYFNHGVFRIKEKAEIDEIRDEEAEDLQKLEELLAEFEAKRNELDIPFEDFIKEYWQPRMKEVLKEGTLDEDALREIGVKVH